MSSNSVCNHTRDKQIGLPLRGRPILLSLVWLQTELNSTQSYYHYKERRLWKNQPRQQIIIPLYARNKTTTWPSFALLISTLKKLKKLEPRVANLKVWLGKTFPVATGSNYLLTRKRVMFKVLLKSFTETLIDTHVCCTTCVNIKLTQFYFFL